jgi:hypothetical protein
MTIMMYGRYQCALSGAQVDQFVQDGFVRGPYQLHRDGGSYSPVEIAIRQTLQSQSARGRPTYDGELHRRLTLARAHEPFANSAKPLALSIGDPHGRAIGKQEVAVRDNGFAARQAGTNDHFVGS